MRIGAALVGLSLVMILLSLSQAQRIPGLEAMYGALGAIFLALATKVLSSLLQREGLHDD